MRPLNMADDASAISAASPAANTGSPAASAWALNSAMGSRPTATSSVSQANVFSVPGSGRKRASTSAMVTDSTRSPPLADRTVCEV